MMGLNGVNGQPIHPIKPIKPIKPITPIHPPHAQSFPMERLRVIFAPMETPDPTARHIAILEEKAAEGDTDAIRTIHLLRQQQAIETLRRELFGI